jgi:putative peptide-modifying radical SAM enzyme
MNEVNNILFTLRECQSKDLDNKSRIYEILDMLAHMFNSKIVHRSYKYYGSYGINVCFFLSTSHIIYSSWPEHNLALLEVSTCAKLPNLRIIKNFLKKEMGCTNIQIKIVKVMLKKISKKNINDIIKYFPVNRLERIEKLGRSTQSQNYVIHTKNTRYVLKVYLERNEEEINLELDLINFLNKMKPDLYPKIFPTKNGEVFLFYQGYYVCLMQYLDGEFLDSSKFNNQNFYEVGQKLAELHSDFSKFKHQNIESDNHDLFNNISFEDHKKILSKARIPIKKLTDISNALNKSLNISKNNIMRGILHNDFTDWNMRLKNNHISGIFDFSDICSGFLISDVATTIAETCFIKNNLLRRGAMVSILRGYLSRASLSFNEISLLIPLIRKRMLYIIKYCADKYKLFGEKKYLKFIKDYYSKLIYLNKNEYSFINSLANSFSPHRLIDGNPEDYLYFNIFITRKCNLNCKYCGENPLQKSLPEEISYSVDDLKRFFSKIPNAVITFYGGEPLLKLDLVKSIMDNVPAKYFMLQTNGIFLDKLEPKYVNRFHTILLSIDGSKKITDLYRGNGTYDKINKNAIKIIQNGFAGQLVARMTVSENTKNIDKEVLSLFKNNFYQVHWQLNALFGKQEYDWDKPFSVWAKKHYNPAIKRLIFKWVRSMKNGEVIRIFPFIGIMHSLIKKEKSLLRCGAGWIFFNIFTDGKISSCPVMRGIKKFSLGDIFTTKPAKLRNSLFVKEPCNNCDYYGLCGGRCLYANLTKDWGEEAYNQVCDTIKFLIDNLKDHLPYIKDLIRKGIISEEDFDYTKYNGCEIIP